MSYLVSRNGYNGLGVDPVTSGTTSGLSLPGLNLPAPKTSAPKTSEPKWWEKIIGAGTSVLTDYGAASRARAEAQLLAQQQVSAGGSSMTPMLLVGGAVAVGAYLILRKKK